MTYNFHINDFEGPLDLLLHMVKASEMDIYEINIRNIIDEVVSSLSIVSVTKSDKGRIMKDLMPKVKGKADGKLVNSILETYFN